MKLIKINGLYRTKNPNQNGAYGYVENMENLYWVYGSCDVDGENRKITDALNRKYIAVNSLGKQFGFMKIQEEI